MRRLAWRVLVAAWLVAAFVFWNAVFDAHVRAGAREYVDRQAAATQDGGAPVDMDAVMRAAVSSGLRAATAYTLLLLAPLGVAVFYRKKQGSSPAPTDDRRVR